MDIREKFFNYRSYTPIPLLIAALVLARSSWISILVGLGVVVLGEVLRLWAVRYAGGATRTTSGVGGDKLVTNGPFAYVRNPLYLGNFILSLGLLLMAWAWMPWLLIIYLLLYAVQYGCIISLEEEYLQQKFGTSFSEYRRRVPRFLPRISPFEKSVGEHQTLRRMLRTERHTLQSVVLVSVAILVRWQAF